MTDLTYWYLVTVPFKFTNRPDDVMAIKIKLYLFLLICNGSMFCVIRENMVLKYGLHIP
jgi:hypothetical protein